MRFKNRKWASPFFIVSLAIAGIFGASAVVIDKEVKETPVVEKAEAAEDLTAKTKGQLFFLDMSFSDWNQSGAKFTLVFYGSSKGHNGYWAEVRAQSESLVSNIYSFTIPGDTGETWSYVAAWRLDSSGSNPWNKTNKTIDAKTIGTNHNCIKVTGWDDSATIGTYYGIKSEASTYVNFDWATWWNDGAGTSSWQRIYYFGAFDGSGDVWSEPMTVVQYTDPDKILETMVPGTGKRYAGYKAVRLDRSTTTDAWNHVLNQTSNLVVLSYKDGSLNNCIKPYSDNTGYDLYHLSNSDRKGYYAKCFFENITCDQTDPYNPHPSGSWNNIKTEYNNISKEVQGEIWSTTASYGTEGISAAMYRYDYIVAKYPHGESDTYYDFIKRHGTQYCAFAISHFNPLASLLNTEQDFSTIIIIASSSFALLSITALSVILVKKRKRKEN